MIKFEWIRGLEFLHFPAFTYTKMYGACKGKKNRMKRLFQTNQIFIYLFKTDWYGIFKNRNSKSESKEYN